MGTRVFRRRARAFLPSAVRSAVEHHGAGPEVRCDRRPRAGRTRIVLSALALRLSAPLAPLDGPNLAFQDACNARAGRLWWPLAVPAADASMPTAAHGLYVLHAWVIARVLGLPRGRAWAAATVASWACFTGAWDRRAATHEPAGS